MLVCVVFFSISKTRSSSSELSASNFSVLSFSGSGSFGAKTNDVSGTGADCGGGGEVTSPEVGVALSVCACAGSSRATSSAAVSLGGLYPASQRTDRSRRLTNILCPRELTLAGARTDCATRRANAICSSTVGYLCSGSS